MKKDRIKKILLQEPFILFCGAGISVEAPTLIPSWNSLRDTILSAICESDNYLSELLPELLGQNIKPEIVFSAFNKQIPKFVNTIVSPLTSIEPNQNHIIIAKLAKLGLLRTIFTTNWDTCIEKALLNENVSFLQFTEEDLKDPFDMLKSIKLEKLHIFKLHGCASKPSSIIATIEDLTKQKPMKWRTILKFYILSSNSIFWGFKGSELNLGDYLGITHKGPIENNVIITGEIDNKNLNKYIFWDEYEKGTIGENVKNYGELLNKEDPQNPFRRKNFVITQRAFPECFINMLPKEIIESFFQKDYTLSRNKIENLIRDSLIELLNDQSTFINASFGICELLDNLGLNDKLYDFILHLEDKPKNQLQAAETQILKGKTLLESKYFIDAEQELNRAINILDKIEGKDADLLKAIVFNNLGLIRYFEGFHEWALKEYKKAVELFEHYNAVESSGILCNIALVFNSQGDKSKAFGLFATDLDFCKKNGNIYGTIKTMESLKMISIKLNDVRNTEIIQEIIDELTQMLK